MKMYLVLHPDPMEGGHGPIEVFMTRPDWLWYMRSMVDDPTAAIWISSLDINPSNLSDDDLIQHVRTHTDCSVGEATLVGPDVDSGQGYKEVVVLLRPIANSLDKATSMDGEGVVGVYSSAADLPQPLLPKDEIHMAMVHKPWPEWAPRPKLGEQHPKQGPTLNELEYPNIYAFWYILGHGESVLGQLRTAAHTNFAELNKAELKLGSYTFMEVVAYMACERDDYPLFEVQEILVENLPDIGWRIT